MKIHINFRFALVCLIVGFVLTALSNLKSLSNGVDAKEYDSKRWEVELKPVANNITSTDYTTLRDRTFQLLPRREREKLLGYSEQADDNVAPEPTKVIDKTLKPSFIKLNEDYQIGLVGIFKDQKSFGVFQQINFETQASSFLKVEVNSQIGPYKLVQLSERSAQLMLSNQLITMNLFKSK